MLGCVQTVLLFVIGTDIQLNIRKTERKFFLLHDTTLILTFLDIARDAIRYIIMVQPSLKIKYNERSCTCRDITTKFRYRDGCENWNVRLQDPHYSWKESGTEQLHLPHFVNYKKICTLLYLIFTWLKGNNTKYMDGSTFCRSFFSITGSLWHKHTVYLQLISIADTSTSSGIKTTKFCQ
jgi:hypothetical protein